jgi:hypothetical protein
MMHAISAFRDRFLGRGTAAVTIPPLDGALKPNNRLEDAPPGVAAPAPDNLVRFDGAPLFSSGARLMRGEAAVATLPSAITAMAAAPDGATLAVACADGALHLFDAELNRRPLRAKLPPCVTAMAFVGIDALIVCVGSAAHAAEDWQRDLLLHGRSGSLWRVSLASGETSRVADGLAFPYGVAAAGEGFVVAESWAKRLVRLDANGRIAGAPLEDLPGFPARLSPSSRGGHWLCVFAPRSQLIEFVLREPAYRDAMMAEVDPSLWVAPALKSNVSFFEPMQGGALKQMGVLKPWAPTRSYGLVVELDARFQPLRSFHSRTGGRRHGVTSALERDGRLWLTSKGGDEVVALDLSSGTA